ncbi:MAG: hypothetical protein GY790_09580 [Bacteroidetes bacterium]|nr:hypothetical protein [Bacteroidota bacterium]
MAEEGMSLHFTTHSYTSGKKGVQRGHVLIGPKAEAEFDRMKGAGIVLQFDPESP